MLEGKTKHPKPFYRCSVFQELRVVVGFVLAYELELSIYKAKNFRFDVTLHKR